MCIAPVRLDNGIEVACRDCWQCRANRVNDWVGRSIAESKSSVASHMVTLTYGRGADGTPDNPNAVYLTYSDVQKLFKRLRKAGHKFRYVAVGEYGSRKGRAHWHIIMFWKNAVPKHELDVRFQWKHWDDGFTMFQNVRFESFKYALKYIQKDIGGAAKETKQAMLRMSKQPPIGLAWFQDLALRYAKAGLAPQDLFYSWPEVVSSTGNKVQFKIQGRSAELFLDHYLHCWRILYPGRHLPVSELVEEYQDALVSDVVEMMNFENRLHQRDIEFQRKRYSAVPHGLPEEMLQRMFPSDDWRQPSSLSEEMADWRYEQWLEEIDALNESQSETSLDKLRMQEEWQRRKGA